MEIYGAGRKVIIGPWTVMHDGKTYHPTLGEMHRSLDSDEIGLVFNLPKDDPRGLRIFVAATRSEEVKDEQG